MNESEQSTGFGEEGAGSKTADVQFDAASIKPRNSLDRELLIGIFSYWAELREINGEFLQEAALCAEWIVTLKGGGKCREGEK
jgi:hypothetical protein